MLHPDTGTAKNGLAGQDFNGGDHARVSLPYPARPFVTICRTGFSTISTLVVLIRATHGIIISSNGEHATAVQTLCQR